MFKADLLSHHEAFYQALEQYEKLHNRRHDRVSTSTADTSSRPSVLYRQIQEYCFVNKVRWAVFKDEKFIGTYMANSGFEAVKYYEQLRRDEAGYCTSFCLYRTHSSMVNDFYSVAIAVPDYDSKGDEDSYAFKCTMEKFIVDDQFEIEILTMPI